MTAPAHAPAIAFLRRAGLFTAVLALIAGIFGMHVMTTTHAVHSPATERAVSAHHASSGAGHTGDHTPGPSSAPDMPPATGEAGTRTVQCTDSGTCTSMQAMTGSCTPSAKTGSLAAPLPGTGIIGRNTNTGTLATISARWAYLPGSPSPGELCISRT
ncbi:hypothetical protein ASF98_05805 [Arthrobacter sp. Leaf337]|uniref:hypothetical protein n=1 Tax=Arthrobacter sp. Leaf337 TaxID=1736342 RepID=UPI0006FEA990|nr:hypothetical protein [Arthrobacter sp. Leaf337]KQR75342.1 hypothetical protein ASF98_05805 [Arthrobacter sp. Leaf337]